MKLSQEVAIIYCSCFGKCLRYDSILAGYYMKQHNLHTLQILQVSVDTFFSLNARKWSLRHFNPPNLNAPAMTELTLPDDSASKQVTPPGLFPRISR